MFDIINTLGDVIGVFLLLPVVYLIAIVVLGFVEAYQDKGNDKWGV